MIYKIVLIRSWNDIKDDISYTIVYYLIYYYILWYIYIYTHSSLSHWNIIIYQLVVSGIDGVISTACGICAGCEVWGDSVRKNTMEQCNHQTPWEPSSTLGWEATIYGGLTRFNSLTIKNMGIFIVEKLWKIWWYNSLVVSILMGYPHCLDG